MFDIFADYVPANSTSEQARAPFADFDWLAESRDYMFHFQTGIHVLEIKADSTLYGVALFPKDGVTDWTLSIRLSGYLGDGELRRFFSQTGLKEARLIEFALEYSDGHAEIVDLKGKRRWPSKW
jgi:hypothetical protein